MSVKSQSAPTSAPVPASPRLLDRLREAIRAKHYSIRTEDAYHDWVKRFTLRAFHDKRHPETLSVPSYRGGEVSKPVAPAKQRSSKRAGSSFR